MAEIHVSNFSLFGIACLLFAFLYNRFKGSALTTLLPTMQGAAGPVLGGRGGGVRFSVQNAPGPGKSPLPAVATSGRAARRGLSLCPQKKLNE